MKIARLEPKDIVLVSGSGENFYAVVSGVKKENLQNKDDRGEHRAPQAACEPSIGKNEFQRKEINPLITDNFDLVYRPNGAKTWYGLEMAPLRGVFRNELRIPTRVVKYPPATF